MRDHWPEMRALILVASAAKKDVSSTAGMQNTVRTSRLFRTRADVVVPAQMQAMERAIHERDFEAFAKVTMQESNSFHATCLDTDPPIFYLNDVSRAAIRAVDRVNENAGRVVAAYTFDAGPNAVVYYLDPDKEVVLGAFKHVTQGKEGWEGEQGIEIKGLEGVIGEVNEKVLAEGVSRVILTSVGDGPISIQDHLVDEKGPAET